MKILIATMPRSGSKYIQGNIQTYLKTLGPTFTVTSPKEQGLLGCSEFLVLRNCPGNFEFRSYLTPDGNCRLVNEEVLPDELENRINLIANTDKNLVLKELVLYNNQIDRIMPIFDKVVVLHRDLVHTVISNVIALQTKRWHRTNDIDQIIEDTKQNKLVIPKEDVVHTLRMHDQFNQRVWPANTVHVFFDEAIQLQDAKSFCELLDLEYVDFNFVNGKGHKEYMNHKYEMIENLDEVMDWIYSY